MISVLAVVQFTREGNLIIFFFCVYVSTCLTNRNDDDEMRQQVTCHSSNPCTLSGFSFLTATVIPTPLFVGFSVFSSTHPLQTRPNPPSPRTVSGLKFLVALFSSAKVKIRRLGTSRIRPPKHASSTFSTLLPMDCRKVALLMLESPSDTEMLSPWGFPADRPVREEKETKTKPWPSISENR